MMSEAVSSVLKPEGEDQPYEYLRNRMNQIYKDFVDLNDAQAVNHIRYCSKYGVENPRTIKGGRANSGKQMLKCCACGRRFVHNSGMFTFYSHESTGQWSDFIKSTFSGDSVLESAALIDVSDRIAFRMQH